MTAPRSGAIFPPGVFLTQEALHARRTLPPTPARLLDRVLYIPSYSDTVTHLPVYEFTAEFQRGRQVRAHRE